LAAAPDHRNLNLPPPSTISICLRLPTFFTNANTPPPDAAQQNSFPSAHNFPANRGQRATDAATSCQQSNIAAGNVGDCVTVPSGTRTRQPNQVDILCLMNEQMKQGIASLNNLAPSAADQRRIQLEGAISSALSRMAQYTAMSMNTDGILRRIELLKKELDAHMDSMFSLQCILFWKYLYTLSCWHYYISYDSNYKLLSKGASSH
jgi:hypothetical protein